MNIQKVSSNNFKGYDARPLKGFLMSGNPYGLAREMERIAQYEGIKMYSVYSSLFCKEGILKSNKDTFDIWAQDMWTIAKNKLIHLSSNESNEILKKFFNISSSSEQKAMDSNIALQTFRHIAGGNLFIVKNDGREDLLIGDNDFKESDYANLAKIYGIDKIIPIPQMDYHIDLFIRPLNNKKILIADDNLTINILKEGKAKLDNYIATLPPSKQKAYDKIKKNFNHEIEEFQKSIKLNKNPQTENIEKILKYNGYETIRVPGRIYDTIELNQEYYLTHICNYINANAFINPKGDLVYITNKSIIDELLGLTPELSKKIGFSFEDSFIKSIEPFVERKHIHFVEGKNGFVKRHMLTVCLGGIHCATMEIPEDVIINEQNSKSR